MTTIKQIIFYSLFPFQEYINIFFNIFSTDTVHHSRRSGMPLDDGLDLRNDVIASFNFVNQILPIERTDQLPRPVESQLGGHIAAHFFGCRRRVGVHARLRKRFLEDAQLAVFRPKVMAPGTNAMGLVDGQQGDLAACEQGEEFAMLVAS